VWDALQNYTPKQQQMREQHTSAAANGGAAHTQAAANEGAARQ